MPRIRTIKPEFWIDKKIRSVPRDARLMFIGLLNLADDVGRYVADPDIIKAQLFVSDDDLDFEVVSNTLRSLAEASLIRLYTVNGEDFLDIPNFLRHQKIDKPSGPKHPAFVEPSPKPPRKVDDPSTGERKGKEGKGKEVNLLAQPKPARPSESPNPKPPKQDKTKDFDLFWAAYPKKKSKGTAEKAWKALKPDVDLVETILAAVATAKASDDWRKDKGQFIPHPATWLRAKGWEDSNTPAGADPIERTIQPNQSPSAITDAEWAERDKKVADFKKRAIEFPCPDCDGKYYALPESDPGSCHKCRVETAISKGREARAQVKGGE